MSTESERQHHDVFAEFHIHSGSRQNTFCITNPKYKMPPPPSLEGWERIELDNISYAHS